MLNLDLIKKLRSEKLGFFRFKKLNQETYIITNDIGKYAYLDRSEFAEFIAGNIIEGHGRYAELLADGFIKNDTYSQNITEAYALKNQFLSYGPVLHIIVVTIRCNHKCKYCHAAAAPLDAKKYDMTEDIARKTVDTIFCSPSNQLTIEFQGGEPLLNWEIVRFIIEYAKMKGKETGKNIEFALVTNLSLMDEEKFTYIIENKIGLSTSLDGTEDIHNFNRTFIGGNSYQMVTHWIKRINTTYEKCGSQNRVGALLTVTRKTLSSPKEVIDTYISLGLKSIFLRPLNPYGFAAADLENLGYTNEEFLAFFQAALSYIIQLNTAGVSIEEVHSKIYLSKILTPYDPNYLDTRSPCGACIGQVAYNYNGKIYSCDEGRMLSRMGDEAFLMTEVSNDAHSTFAQMGDSPTTKAMVQMSTLDGLPGYNESVYKPFIGVCPINSYKTTGNCIPIYAKDHKRVLDEKILDTLFLHLKNKEVERVFQKWFSPENTRMGAIGQCELF